MAEKNIEQVARDFQQKQGQFLEELLEELSNSIALAVNGVKKAYSIKDRGKNNSKLTKNNPVKIKKGGRVIFGGTSQGFRSAIEPFDLQQLSEAIKIQASGKVNSNKKADYEIKVDGSVLFRQEKNGEVTINKFAEREITRNKQEQIQDVDLNKNGNKQEQIQDVDLNRDEELASLIAQKVKKITDALASQLKSLSQIRDNVDLDRDGLNKAEEVAKNTDTHNQDTDGDGQNDKVDKQPTQNENNTIKLLQADLDEISVGQAFKQLGQAIVRDIKRNVSTLVKGASSWVKAVRQWQQDMKLAYTASKLHKEYNATQNHNYQSNKYNISRSGHVYSVTDKDNNILFRYKETPFGKKVLDNNLSQENHQDFKNARQLFSKEKRFEDKGVKLDSLGQLTPSGADKIEADRQAYKVMKVANKVLHYAGKKELDTSRYILQAEENNNVTVISKNDRATLLKIENGKTTVNNLDSKDLETFEKIDREVDKKVKEIKTEERKAKRAAMKTPNLQPEHSK